MQGPYNNLYLAIGNLTGITTYEFALLVAAATCAHPDGSNMHAGVDVLARRSHMSKRNATKVLAQLREKRLLERTDKAGGGHTDIYRINVAVRPNFTQPAATPQRTEADKVLAVVFSGQGGQQLPEEGAITGDIPITPRPALPSSIPVRLDPKTGSISRNLKGGTVRTLYPDSFIPPMLNTKGDNSTTTESAAPSINQRFGSEDSVIRMLQQDRLGIDYIKLVAYRHHMTEERLEELLAIHQPNHRKS